MATYVHFTNEQKERARRTDLVAFLEKQGEQVKRAGSEYEWRDGFGKVSIRGNLWFHQYEREGGDCDRRGDGACFERRHLSCAYL